MSAAIRSSFVYVTIIRTSPEKLWEALTDPWFIRQYWYGVNVECTWRKGASWRMAFPDRRLADAGEILEIDRPRRIVIRWQNEWNPEMKAEGPSRCTIDLEPLDGAVKLTITHDGLVPEKECYSRCSDGWNMIIKEYLFGFITDGRVAAQLYR